MKINQCRSRMRVMLPLMLLSFAAANGQAQSLLDDYIREGIRNNLVLENKRASVRQAEQALQIARSHFLPTVQLLADYSSGDGGRAISMPVGDLLNPVYATLNEFTQRDFPQIGNVTENFLPKNFYDARVRTSVPLLNPYLPLGRDIRSREVLVRQYEMEAYKRQLVMDIKVSYYNLLAAEAKVRIYESAQALVAQNVEVNESLLRNGKNLPANVIRSKSELQSVRARINSARNDVKNARGYFNFLMNRDINAPVETEEADEIGLPVVGKTHRTAGVYREEIQALKSALEINQSSLRMKQLERLPKINAFLDVGMQASDWQLGNDAEYYLAGVQVSLPLFQGLRTNRSIRMEKMEMEKTERTIRQSTHQFDLAVTVAGNDLQTAFQNHEAAAAQLDAARSYFRLVDKGYREGVNTLIEFIDARNQLTTAHLDQNLRLFEVHIAAARLERETASYSFDNE